MIYSRFSQPLLYLVKFLKVISGFAASLKLTKTISLKAATIDRKIIPIFYYSCYLPTSWWSLVRGFTGLTDNFPIQ